MTNEAEWLEELQSELGQKQDFRCNQCEYAKLTEFSVTCDYHGSNPVNDCEITREYLNM